MDPTIAILIADPDEVTHARIFTDLVAGRTHALVCDFPDSEDALPHTELGMSRASHVYEQ